MGVLSFKGLQQAGEINGLAVTFSLSTKGNEKSCPWKETIPGTRSDWVRPADCQLLSDSEIQEKGLEKGRLSLDEAE